MKTCDVCVVGAGPAGVGAALAAAGTGATVMLIDEQPQPGGRLRERVALVADVTKSDGASLPAVQVAGKLAAMVEASPVEFVSGIVWGLFEDNVLGVLAGDECFSVQAGAITVATGSTDVVRPFSGWTLPGVITSQQLQRLLHLERVLPGSRYVVIGDGELATEVEHDIEAAGGQIVARCPNVAAIEASGAAKVERVRINGEEHNADVVVIALGKQPDAALALQARVSLRFDAGSRTQVPAIDSVCRTSDSRLFVAGDAAQVTSERAAFAHGQLAGTAASGASAEMIESARLASASTLGSIGDSIDFFLPALSDGELVCRCEQVGAATVRQAIGEGALTLNDVKRRTRCGMGLCQGIFCLGTVAELIHQQAGVAYEQLEPMTYRPPARPIPLEALASMSENEIPIEEVEGKAG